MKLKNPFNRGSRPNPSRTSKISDILGWDHPNLVYLASVIVNEYGAVLDQTSIFTLGISEKRLPYLKEEIEAAIELLLKFLSNKESWDKLIQKYPKIAAEIVTDHYRDALTAGYMELAKFLPDDAEAELCEKASQVFREIHGQGKAFDEIMDELKASWFQEVIQINKRISEDSSSRRKWLQDNFGKKEVHYDRHNI